MEIASLISKPAQLASFPALVSGNSQLRGGVMATSSQHRPDSARHLVSQGDCRHVVISGDISWHKNRIFISEVFRFEELAFELITPGFYRVSFDTWRLENSMPKSFASELREEWSEPAGECIGQQSTADTTQCQHCGFLARRTSLLVAIAFEDGTDYLFSSTR